MVRGLLPVLRESGSGGLARAVPVLLRGEGPPVLVDPMAPDDIVYRKWIRRYEASAARGRSQLAGADAIAITVAMVVDGATDAQVARAIASVTHQAHAKWTLILVTGGMRASAVRGAAQDARIAWHEGSLTSALAGATTPWVALLDTRDALAPNALRRVAAALAAAPAARLVYTDEDRIDALGQRSAGWFKPDWNLDLLRSQDFMSRLAVFDASLVREVGGLHAELGDAAPYDLVLRCIERLVPAQIVHVPEVLYHRHLASATPDGRVDAACGAPNRGEEALHAHLARCGAAAEVQRGLFGFKVRYALPAPPR
ncbi:MAG: hypothetical protein EOO24_60635, partial [Comamonadaceae bacterium]